MHLLHIRNDYEMERFIVKGNEDQWAEALMSKKTDDPDESDLVQIKVNSSAKDSKRRKDKVDVNDETANRKRRKADKVKQEKKSKDKR